MQTTTEIKLDIACNTPPPTVYAKQGDSGTRFIKVILLENGALYTIESEITARIRILKPDKTAIYNFATISNNEIIAELTSQALAVEGVAVAEIGLFKEKQILSTFLFYIIIERSAVSDEQIESSNEFSVLESTIRQATAAMGGMSFAIISRADFDALTSKSPTTSYYVREDNGGVKLYLGDVEISGGGLSSAFANAVVQRSSGFSAQVNEKTETEE